MHFVFGVPIHGSLLFLYVMALVYIFALLSIGLYVSIGAQTQQQAQGTIQMFFLPSMFLSGYIFPLASLPWPLRFLGQLFPVTHFIEIMRGVVLRGAGPLELWRVPRARRDLGGAHRGERAEVPEDLAGLRGARRTRGAHARARPRQRVAGGVSISTLSRPAGALPGRARRRRAPRDPRGCSRPPSSRGLR